MVLPCYIVQDLFLLDDCKIILSSTRMVFFWHQPSHNRRGLSSPSYSLSRDLITSEIIHLLWKERNQTILHYEWNQSLGVTNSSSSTLLDPLLLMCLISAYDRWKMESYFTHPMHNNILSRWRTGTLVGLLCGRPCSWSAVWLWMHGDTHLNFSPALTLKEQTPFYDISMEVGVSLQRGWMDVVGLQNGVVIACSWIIILLHCIDR